MKEIPYGRQSISESDIRAVSEALRATRITQGPIVDNFEKAICDYVGSRFAVACNSATSGLYIAYRAMGIGEGSLVWTVTNTFVATSNAALLCGADVDFIDINAETWNISVEKLESKLREHEKRGLQLPDVVTVVHFAGLPCDLAQIWTLSQTYGFSVLEDASHALGATYKNSKIGDCKFSHAAVFSFHPVKMITTGEGGMVTTNDEELARKCEELRSHGVTREPDKLRNPPRGDWYFEQQDLGINLRITDIQCALGLSQLARIDQFVARRRSLAKYYISLMSDLPYTHQLEDADRISSYHLFAIRTNKHNRDELITELKKHGISCSVHYIPVPFHPFYRELGFNPSSYPESERYFETALSIPLFVDLDELEQERVISHLSEFC